MPANHVTPTRTPIDQSKRPRVLAYPGPSSVRRRFAGAAPLASELTAAASRTSRCARGPGRAGRGCC
jgi:hypothetical protein